MTLELVIRSILLGAGLAMDAFSVSLADGLSERKMSTERALTIAGTFAAFQFFMPIAGWFLVRTAADMFETFRRFIPWIAFILLLYIGGKMLIEGIRENKDAGCGNADDIAAIYPDSVSDISASSVDTGEQAAAFAGRTEPVIRDAHRFTEQDPINTEEAFGYGDDTVDLTHENEPPDGGGRLGSGDLFLQGVATSIDALSVGFTIASYTIMNAVTSSLIIGVVTLFICIAGLRLGRSIGTRLSGRASIFGGVILIAIGAEVLIKGIFQT